MARRLADALAYAGEGRFDGAAGALHRAMLDELGGGTELGALGGFLERLSGLTFDIEAEEQRRVGPDHKPYTSAEFQSKRAQWNWDSAPSPLGGTATTTEGNGECKLGPDKKPYTRAHFEAESSRWSWSAAEELDTCGRPPWKMGAFLEEGLGDIVAELIAPKPLRDQSDAASAFMKAIGRLASEESEADRGLVVASVARWLDLKMASTKIAEALVRRATRISSAACVTGEQLNDKFAASGNTFELSFGRESDFFGGLEPRVGAPSVNIVEAIRKEHCDSCDSHARWTTGNYGITTCPETEFLLVTGDLQRQLLTGGDHLPDNDDEVQQWQDEAKEFPPLEKCRVEWPMETKNLQHPRASQRAVDWLRCLRESNSKLRQKGETQMLLIEGFMLSMYTGPMFEKYNAVNRGGSQVGDVNPFMEKQFRVLCSKGDDDGEEEADKGEVNRYPTSIHTLSSALIKQTKLAKAVTVYRGMTGGVLPTQFWQPDPDSGTRGGVEYGFLSTTTNKQVAMQYAHGKGAGTVLEMQTGMIDRGAEIKGFSQYPHEEEVCFPPLTSMQVVDTRVSESVLVVSTRLNLNLASPTIEEVIGKRRKIAKDMFDNLHSEAKRELLPWVQRPDRGAIRMMLLSKLEAGLESLAHQDLSRFNQDADYLEFMRHAMRFKRAAILVRRMVDDGEGARFEDPAEDAEAIGQLFPDGDALPEEAARGWKLLKTHMRLQRMTLAMQSENENVRSSTIKELVQVVWEQAGQCLEELGRKATLGEVANELVARPPAKELSAVNEVSEKIRDGSLEQAALQMLKGAVKDEEYPVRKEAGAALGLCAAAVGPEQAAQQAVPMLGDLAKDESPPVREATCAALGLCAAAVGPEQAAQQVVPMLGDLAKDEDDDVREAACVALGQCVAVVGPDQVAQQVVPTLGDVAKDARSSYDYNVREAACAALGQCAAAVGPEQAAQQVVPMLGDLAKEEAKEFDDYHVREAACAALGQCAAAVGPEQAAQQVVPLLGDVAKDDSHHVRRATCAALGLCAAAVGPEQAAQQVVPTLGDLAEDEERIVRQAACAALGQCAAAVGPEQVAQQVVPMLGDLAEDDEFVVRKAACAALGQCAAAVGPEQAAQQVVPLLEALSKDDATDPRVPLHMRDTIVSDKAQEQLRALIAA